MSSEDDQYDRENYSLIIINLLDTDLEDNSKITALIYLNGELDDTIKIKGSTTIFIHKQDLLTFEIKDMSPPQTIGVIEITTLQLLSESDRIFQKWLPAVYNQKMHKILFEFEIQKMGTLNSSKIIRNQVNTNEADAVSHQRSSQRVQSQLSGSDKYLPTIQSTQLNNGNQFAFNKTDEISKQNQSPSKNVNNKQSADYQKYLDNDLSQNKANKSQGIEDQQQQRNQAERNDQQVQNQQGGDNFTISPIKVIEDQELKRPGYTFQKLGQNNQLLLSDPQAAQISNSGDLNFQIQGQLTSSVSPSGPSQALFTADHNQIYDVLEDELVKLSKKIQNKNFNSLIDKRRSQYIELKNLLKDISEQFETLKKHPCRSCEKKYIPSIQKGIQKLYSGYKQLMDQISQSQLLQSSQQQQQLQQSKQQMPVQEFIQSLSSSKKAIAVQAAKQNSSRSKSPITTRSQVQTQNLQNSMGKSGKVALQASNVTNQQLNKQTATYQMSPNNLKKLDKLKEEEQKAHDLQMNSNFIRDQLEAQFRRTHDLETENKQLKLRNFILEGDLKNLLKRIQQEKLSFSTRATFKLQEFRQIFEYFHSLRLERETLLDEIHQLQEELNINQSGDKKKLHPNTNSQRQSIQQKSIKQTMHEYSKYKKETLSAVQQEEIRVENELAEGRNNHFISSSSQQYGYPAHKISQSLSPKPRDGNYGVYEYQNGRVDQFQKDKSYPSHLYEEEIQQGAYYQNESNRNLKGTQNSYPYIGENPVYSQSSHYKNEQSSPSQVGGSYDTKSKENGPHSSASARSEIHHLLNQRKNVINELLEKIGEI